MASFITVMGLAAMRGLSGCLGGQFRRGAVRIKKIV
jgi:hypothetical protein